MLALCCLPCRSRTWRVVNPQQIYMFVSRPRKLDGFVCCCSLNQCPVSLMFSTPAKYESLILLFCVDAGCDGELSGGRRSLGRHHCAAHFTVHTQSQLPSRKIAVYPFFPVRTFCTCGYFSIASYSFLFDNVEMTL